MDAFRVHALFDTDDLIGCYSFGQNTLPAHNWRRQSAVIVRKKYRAGW